MEALSGLHFLRPQWLWALLALPLLWALWRRGQAREDVWRATVDAHLLPHLLEARARGRAAVGFVPLALAAVLAVLALAGPSWRTVEQPVWQRRAPLVVALDLSGAILATDLPPSRLAQARAKLRTLLERRRDGQIALVAYAGDAFTVTPLTEDPANVALYLDALHPDIMPVEGQRADRAIAWSRRLLERAGFREGDILLLTDRADHDAERAAGEAAGAGFRVSVLGLGTDAGANYRRRDGAIVPARLDPASLRRVAQAGGGRFAALAADAGDLERLGALDAPARDGVARGRTTRVPQDGGFWLLPPLMLLALLAFRRRAGVLLLACVGALGWPQPAMAQDGWWRRADQIAHARIEAGNRAYRSGDYAQAARLYADADTADGHYNRGNALAKAGRYREAIAAYDAALARRPGMADALANRRAVEALLKRQPPGPRQDERGRPSRAPTPRSGERGDAAESERAQARAERGRGTPRDPAPPRMPPPDAQAQRAADAAQRARIEQALRQGGTRTQGTPSDRRAPERDDPIARERRIANEAWLKRVQDDPGSLLAEKFRIEYERRRLRGEVE